MPKVLLIEDDHETAQEITAELVHRGFDVDWAATGIAGLDKARAGEADAMIVDRLLPGVDGLTIIEVVRQERVRTPVLVLSALGAVDDRVRGLRAGGDDYLTKPFAIVELIAGWKPCCGGRRRTAIPCYGSVLSSSICWRVPPNGVSARSTSCRVNFACSST